MHLGTREIALLLRRRALDKERQCVLMSNFIGSVQEADLSLPPNCHGFGRVHHFRRNRDSRWIPNPLPIDPASEFFQAGTPDSLPVQTFQLSVCDYRCWYCYVDEPMLSGSQKHAKFISMDELFDVFLAEAPKVNTISLSGGQPDIVPEYSLWFVDTRSKRGRIDDFFIWIDDNLSTDFTWEFLSDEDISRLSQAPGVARVGCLKGIDDESFIYNTKTPESGLKKQIERLGKLTRSGFDQYGYITLTTPTLNKTRDNIKILFDLIQENVHENFPLRIVPLQIFPYKVNAGSFDDGAVANQFHVLDHWMREIEDRFDATARQMRINHVKVR